MLVGNVAHAALLRFEALAVDFLGDDLGAADLQLVALTTHRLDQHGELELATAGDLDHVGRAGLEQLDRHVAEQLALQAVDQVAAGEVLALLARHRRRVDTEGHAQHRLVDDEAGQCHRVLDRGDGVADLDLGETGHDEQVAGRQLVGLVAADAFEGHELGEAALERGLTLGELLLEQGHGLATAHDAVHHTTDGQTAEVLARVELGDHGLERLGGVALGSRDGLEDRVEQGRQVGALLGHADALHRPALAGHGGDDLEVDVLVTGVEVDEQLVHLVEDLVGAGVLAVDLVDDDDGRQVLGECLLQHVAGLRQGPLGGVDEQQHAVDHGERTLDLTAEVGVAGRVDQVDLGAFPGDRRGLGEDGDPALALLVVGVHDSIDHRLVGGECSGGTQQRVDERGLAVVDVGYERDVTNSSAHDSLGVGSSWSGTVRRECARVWWKSVVVGLVVRLVVVLVERDAVLFSKRCVLVVLSTLPVAIAAEAQIECAGACLLELARFFEAAVTTLLHGRAPEL